MRALVTGATGFVGRYLVLELRRRGWNVICLVRRQVEPVDPEIECVTADLSQPTDIPFLQLAVRPIDALFHFGALLPGKEISARQYLTVNSTATAHLLEIAANLDIKSVVYASSLPFIGRPEHLPINEDHSTKPMHPYHLSKLCGELACEMARRISGRSITSLRITSPYGPGMQSRVVLSRFVESTLRSKDIHWLGGGTRAQNFVHVRDVVRAALLATATQNPGVYNVGGRETTTMKELALLVTQLSPIKGCEATAAEGVDPEEGIRWEIDLTRAQAGLGYTPSIALPDGLADYIEWARSGARAPSWWNS